MSFVKRIKEYIKTDKFSSKIKKTIIKDLEENEKNNNLKEDLQKVKNELEGLKFNVKVNIN